MVGRLHAGAVLWANAQRWRTTMCQIDKYTAYKETALPVPYN
jgi:hypothetical protein